MLEKCRYFHDHQAACTLMVDDLSLTATTLDGRVDPSNDWGYGLRGPGSLYQYLEKTLFTRHPEIRGTFFHPLRAHGAQHRGAGWTLLFREPDQAFRDFLKETAERFEVAFHGTDHGRFENPDDPSFTNWKQEFELLKEEDAPRLRAEMARAEENLGVKFRGGKYPGYRGGPAAKAVLEALGFRWWSSSAAMLGRRHARNAHGYLFGGRRILDFPTNVGGDCFNVPLSSRTGLRAALSGLARRHRAEAHLGYLYEAGLVISVQEHFETLRTDGVRQTPNLYDDLASLETVYSMLRGGDVWHATCTDIAAYLDAHDHSDLTEAGGVWTLAYRGAWDAPRLSLASDARALEDLGTGRKLAGVYKRGKWIYNAVAPGRYRAA